MVDAAGIRRVRAVAKLALDDVGHESSRAHVERNSLAHGVNALTDPGEADDSGLPDKRRIYCEDRQCDDDCAHPVLGLDVAGSADLGILCMNCGKRWSPTPTPVSQLIQAVSVSHPWRVRWHPWRVR